MLEKLLCAEYGCVADSCFLCHELICWWRQYRTGKIVNIKKGQFLSPGAMRFAADKVVEAGNDQVMLTERNDFRVSGFDCRLSGYSEMQTLGFPVILDVTFFATT